MQFVALSAIGILLTSVVIQSGLVGLRAVDHDRHTVDRIRQAERLHQDADMQHDALRSDVYNAVLVSFGRVPGTPDTELSDINGDAHLFAADLDGVQALNLPAAVKRTLRGVRPTEDEYIATALHLAGQAFSDRPTALKSLASFDQLFHRAEIALAAVTTRLVRAAEAAAKDADHEAELARDRIVGASIAVLAGLIGLALMLSRLGGRLADSIDALTESDKRSREFVAFAAHQLRTPINATRATTEALIVRGARPDQEELLTALGRETHRAGRLIGDLLHIARLDQGDLPTPQPCDLAALCAAEIDRMQSHTPSITWELDAHDAPDQVLISPDATKEALANVLDNARRHARSKVKMRIVVEGPWLRVLVHDDGPGMSDDVAGRAFNRFVSLDGRGGSGLGLPIARSLAEAQGGTLDYVDQDFVLTLPLNACSVTTAA